MRKKYTPLDNIISGGLALSLGLALCYSSTVAWDNYSPLQERPEVESESVILVPGEIEEVEIINEPIEVEEIQEIPEVATESQEDILEEIYYDSLELLALCVEAEAGNQDLLGKRLVVDAILNRVDDPDFPNSIEGVITQPYQFSTYWSGAMDRIEPSEETYEAINMELKDRLNSKILFFTAKNYSRYGTPWNKIGDHYFSTK